MMQDSKLRFIVLLTMIFLLIGCTEASFKLASDSRLPKWFTLPDGMSRADVMVTMDYYIPPWGRKAEFIMFDKQGHILSKVKGVLKGDKPLKLKNTLPGFDPGYPSYEIITVNNVVDVVEHRRMEPLFYVTDDPAIRAELGVFQ
jgi:hypothetical protein